MNTQKRPADGLAIRYAESDAVGDETVLLLNPWPESLFAWDTIWTRLAQTARLLAIDLPGGPKAGPSCCPLGPWACSCCA